MTYDLRRARALAEAAIREAGLVRNHSPDLINVAPECIVEASLELPASYALDEMATSIRAEVNAQIFAGIVSRMGTDGRQRAQGPLATSGADGKSMFNRLKKSAQRATWSRFKAQAEYLDQVDELSDTAYWLDGVAPGKVADFTRGGGRPGRGHAVAVREGQAAGAGGVPGARHADAGARLPGRDTVQAGGVHRQEGKDRAGGDPAAAARGVGAADQHVPRAASAW